MLKASLKDGLLDNRKAQTVLTSVAKRKPQGLSSIFKFYKRLIENQLGIETLIIETGAKIKNSAQYEKILLAKTEARKVIYKTNPAIVFGAKITHGNWVWEETLGSKLKQIAFVGGSSGRAPDSAQS